MKKIIAILITLCLMLPAAMSFAQAEEEKVLNVFTWETYIDDQTIANFEDLTGIDVVYSPFASNEDMLQKLQMNGGSEYDIVLGSDYALSILRKEGLLKELDKSLLTNYGNLNPKYLSQYFDPENTYAIPYAAGTPLIVYDPEAVDIEITGYEDLWNPALKDSIVIMNDARNVIGITLKTMGKSFNETDPEVLEDAKEKLMPLFQNIRAFDYDTPHQVLLSGDASVAYMFTPQVLWALDGNPNLKVVYPKEGMGFGIDALVVPANAPHPGNAHLFLNYLMEPQVAADVALAQLYLNPNQAAEALLPESYTQNPALFIPDEVLGKTEFIQDVGETESLYQEIWAEFKLQ